MSNGIEAAELENCHSGTDSNEQHDTHESSCRAEADSAYQGPSLNDPINSREGVQAHQSPSQSAASSPKSIVVDGLDQDDEMQMREEVTVKDNVEEVVGGGSNPVRECVPRIDRGPNRTNHSRCRI